ncbi:MAG: DUF177 domain-containing protein [Acidobacteriota bacterium]
MYIETKEIGPSGLVVDRVIQMETDLPLEGDQRVRVDRAHLAGQLHRERGGVSFHGEIETVATLPCSRCLEPYRLPLRMRFELLYTTEPDRGERGEMRVDADDVLLTRYDGVRIDLRELLSEQVYLGLPLKPLCRPECQGLCPRCGANLNHGDCGCPEEKTGDPRLEILKTLL